MEDIIIIKKSELKSILRETFLEIEADKDSNSQITLLTINKVAKKLGKSHTYIKGLVATGILKTTEDGLIPSPEVEKYLRNLK